MDLLLIVGTVLVVAVVLGFLLYTSKDRRMYHDQRDRTTFENERDVEQEIERDRIARRYSYRRG